ncbi:serine/threonine-protein kinase [Pleurocapsa sp. PCC 7319]|uniref:serine/threonine-protein kinase n=1 Tax=Pleurocapsa sp. PCC 7319 TaxID=118161 RepID=UPI00034D17E6|nr:serine/threonine-protein kinase [Pleurocapsa sp. PCC 7319]
MDANLVGKTIQGRYYIVKQLGRGGVGVTFLAQDQQCFDSQCVVKQLKPKSDNPKTLEIARRLFNREAEIMNRLGYCDRIPRLLAYFEDHKDFFLVQELIEGHDLSQEIVSGKPWSEEKTIILLKDILEVLLVVQQHSVIHRDLKPSNLMRRTKDNKIVLIDFGSVKQVSTQVIDTAGQIKQTVAVGTKSYMPMEQMMGRPGFHSDIYAVGIIAIQALTGVTPKQFTFNQNGEIIWRNKLNKKVNYQPRFLNILDKMVRYRFQERYTSAGVVLSDLEQLDAEQNNNKETIVISNQNPPVTKSQQPQGRSNINLTTKIISKQSETANIQQPQLVNHPAYLSSNHNEFLSVNRSESQTKSKSGLKSKVVAAVFVGVGLLAALGTWLHGNNRTVEPEIELSLYENPSQGFRVNYPEVWSKQNRDDFFATGVVFFSPLEDDSDRFKERVSVLVENLSSEMSLAQYTDESIAEIKRLSDPKVGAAQSIILGQSEARQVVYHGEENGNRVQRMQTWSVKNKQAYVITYTAKPDSYDSYLPTVEKMIESFETISN